MNTIQKIFIIVGVGGVVMGCAEGMGIADLYAVSSGIIGGCVVGFFLFKDK